MAFLRRLTGRDEPGPEWAPFFNGQEYRTFLGAVEADLRRRGLAFRLGEGVVHVQVGDGEPNELGLANLAQYCRAVGSEDWPLAIANHFTTLLAAHGRDLDAIAADFEQCRPILRLRLYSDESMGGLSLDRDLGVIKPLVPGILLGLVYDFPDSTSSVAREHVASWSLPEIEVLAVARTNTLAEPLPPRQTVKAGDASFEALQGDSFYVASRLLGLGDLLAGDNVHGAVAAVPNRHTLLWAPIETLDVVAIAPAMARVAAALFQEGPGSISSLLYWWRDGDLMALPVRVTATSVELAPPDAFVELLNGLPPAGPMRGR